MLEHLLAVLLSFVMLAGVYLWDVSRGEAWVELAAKLKAAYQDMHPNERRRREDELAAGCPEELF